LRSLSFAQRTFRSTSYPAALKARDLTSHTSYHEYPEKKLLAAAACLAALCIAINSSAQAGVLMQGRFRNAEAPGKAWWDNLAEKAHEMRSFGFTAIWIPPVLKGDVGGFSTGYDPFDDYDIGSKDQEGTIRTRWGSREQLQRMVAVMRANGLMSMVLNHRNKDSGETFRYKGAFGQENGGRFGKTSADFHHGDQDANVPDESNTFGPTSSMTARASRRVLQMRETG
jgi:alpha-amylase